jgi:hypothetical protein
MLEMKAAVSTIIRHYKVSLENPEETQRFILELVMKGKNGTRVKLKPRAWSAAGT